MYFLALAAFSLKNASAARQRNRIPRNFKMSEQTSYYPELAKEILPAEGRLGVFFPGWAQWPRLSLPASRPSKKALHNRSVRMTQLATIRLGKRTESRTPYIRDFVPLAGLNDLVFGGWDIYEDSAYDAAVHANVLEEKLLNQVKEPLQQIHPMKAVFDPQYIKRINGPNVKQAPNNMDKARMLMDDIQKFKAANGCDRLVMIWCGSTEVFHKPAACHQSVKAFEEGL